MSDGCVGESVKSGRGCGDERVLELNCRRLCTDRRDRMSVPWFDG